MKTTKYMKLVGLLATAAVGLTLASCGGGGGGGGSKAPANGGANNNNNNNTPPTTPSTKEYAPTSLVGKKFKDGSIHYILFTGASTMTYYDGAFYFAGTYRYTKTGADTGTLSFSGSATTINGRWEMASESMNLDFSADSARTLNSPEILFVNKTTGRKLYQLPKTYRIE